MTTMKVQKTVYPPRSAVRGSGIKWLLLSTFRTGVGPGLCDQYPLRPLRYQWKSTPGQITSATRWPSFGHLLLAPGAAIRSSATAAGRTEAQLKDVYIAPSARPGCAKVSVR